MAKTGLHLADSALQATGINKAHRDVLPTRAANAPASVVMRKVSAPIDAVTPAQPTREAGVRDRLTTFLVSANVEATLLARVTAFFSDLGLALVEVGHHTEHTGNEALTFLRATVDLAGLKNPRARACLGARADGKALEDAFADLVEPLGGRWSVAHGATPARVAILCTKDATCLYDLLLRKQTGELPCEIPLVVSNHDALEGAARNFDVPYRHLPLTADTKREQEEQILALLEQERVDLVVMARYMQILSAEFLAAAPPVINIHHSFLPAFQGGKPYHQAHARGVKLIGATAHYATADLDEGPIIEQDVVRVSHASTPEDLVRIGRDVERVVLARAVRAHVEHRIFVEGRRTVVL